MREDRSPDVVPDLVQLRLLYDAFTPSSVEVHEMEYREGATLDQYFDGLPTEHEWKAFHNGQEVALDHAHLHVVNKGDQLGLILIPQGGDGFKAIMRIALTAAVAVVAAITQQWWVIALVAVGAGLVNAFLLTPKSKLGNDSNTSNSYGIDGAKNSAVEGIPYPVIYGEYRVAGNFGDLYTLNVGDDQYLFLRTVLNDGEIEGVYDIEVNEQPLANFTNVETRFKKGTLTEDVNDWFGRSIRQVNKGMKIDTTALVHETSTEVDQLRFDVGFTQGLVQIDQKKGTYKPRSVTFVMEYRLLDPITKQPVQAWTGAANPSNYIGSAANLSIVGTAMRFIVGAQSNVASTAAEARALSANSLEYRVDGGNWVSVAPTLSSEPSVGYNLDPSGDGSIVGDTDITPIANSTYDVTLSKAGVVDLRLPNGTISEVIAYPPNQTGTVTVTDKRTRQIRKSFESGRLARGYYQARIRRTTVTSTDQYLLDEVFLTDVAEIQTDQVALRGTANLSLKIKLNEQLNGIPGLTARVRGSLLQEYDFEGNPTVKRWSNNVAWVALDILAGIERGAGTPKTEIDWPAWLDFAQHCRDNNLAFNGVFETGTTLAEAFQTVLRVGHAAPVPVGNKISVVIDRKRDPVTAFGQGSILKGTFQVTYMPMVDRANEFEVSYFDRNDRNKQKTIRYVDPKAVTFNESQRLSSIALMGVDNIEQARRELWRNIYANRLLIRTIEFESFLESINIVQGENALIAHNMMEWSQSGRTAAGSTTTRIQLDQNVYMEPGKSWGVLILYDAIAQGTAKVSSVIGNKLMIPTASFLSPGKVPARAKVGEVDCEIAQVVKGSQFDTVLLASNDGIKTGDTVTFWDTDVLIEREVVAPAGAVERSFVDVTVAFPVAPASLRNFIFGELRLVKKPYTLTGVSGNGVEKRKLTFMEYDERVYGPAELEIPIPVAPPSDREVAHVQSLLFDYERMVSANRKSLNARVHWTAAGIRNYAGADVYMALNGGAMRPVGTALNMTELLVSLNEGDVPEFKVVAYNKRGDRAPFATAPSVRGTIAVIYATLDPPTGLTVVPTNFDVIGSAAVSWVAPGDGTGVTGYEAQYRRKVETEWLSLGSHTQTRCAMNGLQTGAYVVQVRAVAENSISPWVTKEFTIAVAPTNMQDFSKWNNRNPDPIVAPTTDAATDVEHVINTDGSADISFEFGWGGDEATIDGFEVTWRSTAS